MAEFIAAKDLPVTEAEEVNVLVVDPATGEMAQKAGANLGGSGGETPDMVIRTSCRPDYGSAETTLDPSNVTIVEGTLDNVVAAITEGRVPVVVVETFHNTGGGTGLVHRTYASIYFYAGVYECLYFYAGKQHSQIYIAFADDGTVTSVTSYSF